TGVDEVRGKHGRAIGQAYYIVVLLHTVPCPQHHEPGVAVLLYLGQKRVRLRNPTHGKQHGWSLGRNAQLGARLLSRALRLTTHGEGGEISRARTTDGLHVDVVICAGKDILQIGNVPDESGLFLYIALVNPVPGKIFDEY